MFLFFLVIGVLLMLAASSTREPDPGVSEGVCSIIYAAPRTELKGSTMRTPPTITVYVLMACLPELHVLRDILMHKYGRDFSAAVMENKDGCVSPRVGTSHLARAAHARRDADAAVLLGDQEARDADPVCGARRRLSRRDRQGVQHPVVATKPRRARRR